MFNLAVILCKSNLIFKIFIYFLSFVYIQNVSSFSNTFNEEDATELIWSVAGKRADLPCQNRPRKAGDRPILILWYRDSPKKPVYSYDARLVDFSSGERWSNKSLFGDRAYFVPLTKPPALILEPVMPQDEGLYTCRLDYLDSPTTSTSTRLNVLIFPEPPEILWEGQSVIGPIGPLKENSHHKITCTTRGGRPTPSLVWWLEGHRAMNQEQIKGSAGEIKSILSFQATRNVNMKTLSCHAQSRQGATPLAQPLTASVRLNVTLAPLGIWIEGGESPVPVDTTLTLVCLSWGSHPPAQITWWKSGNKMKSFSYSIKDGGNLTTSAIKFVVEERDHGVSFTCRSSNELVGSHPLVAVRRLNVTYKPTVDLRVKIANKFFTPSEVDSRDGKRVTVKQGSNIQMECSSSANPVPQYIEWHQNGVVIDSGKESWSYLLQSVAKVDSGVYTCSATNSAGRGVSSPYHIIVEHPPECSTGWQKRTHGTEIGRTVTVLCRVEALPANDLTFTWSRVTDKGVNFNFDLKQIQTDGTTSRLTLTPKTLKDFGILLCSASNSVGKQEEPCQVTLVPASTPDPPLNCSADAENAPGSLSVTCSEGFDGGFPQKFILVAIQKGKVEANITRDFPEWMIQNLEYGKSVTLRIYSFNARGRSGSVRLEVFIPVPQVMSDQDVNQNPGNFGYNHTAALPLIGILVGTGGVLIVASMVILSFFCSSRKQIFKWKSKDSSPGFGEATDSHQHDHTMVYSPSNRIRRGDSDGSLYRERLISDPDIVTCIQYGSRESSHKGLDVLPSESQIQRQPLMKSFYEDPKPGFNSCGNLNRLQSDLHQRSGIPQRSQPEIIDLSSKEKTYIYKGEIYLLNPELEDNKGAIPKRKIKEDLSLSLPIIESCYNKLSSDDILSLQNSNSSIPFIDIPKSTNLFATSSLLSSPITCNDPTCDQCLNHINPVGSSLDHLPMLVSSTANDSITYSTACCMDRYGPYYVYKHVKCYPPKNYPYFEGIRSQQQKNILNSSANESTLSNSVNQPIYSSFKEDMSKIREHKSDEHIYESSNPYEGGITEKTAKKKKPWSYNCGGFVCTRKPNGTYQSDSDDSSKMNSVKNDHQLSGTYQRFEGVNPNDPTVTSNDPNGSLELRKRNNQTTFTDRNEENAVTSPASCSNERIKTVKHKPPSAKVRSHGHLSYGSHKRPKFRVPKGSTKSAIRLKELGNSDLYMKKELRRLRAVRAESSTSISNVATSSTNCKVSSVSETKTQETKPRQFENDFINREKLFENLPSIDMPVKKSVFHIEPDIDLIFDLGRGNTFSSFDCRSESRDDCIESSGGATNEASISLEDRVQTDGAYTVNTSNHDNFKVLNKVVTSSENENSTLRNKNESEISTNEKILVENNYLDLKLNPKDKFSQEKNKIVTSDFLSDSVKKENEKSKTLKLPSKKIFLSKGERKDRISANQKPKKVTIIENQSVSPLKSILKKTLN